MSLRNLTPLTKTALLFNQAGTELVVFDNNNTTGHAGGHSGAGSQIYTEIIFGNECRKYTSAHNTTGTYFFPHIEYATCIKGLTIHSSLINVAHTRTEAKSLTGDHLGKDAIYDPDALTLQNIGIENGDEVYGKFTRIAFEQTSSASYLGRALITFGPSLN